jgi:hypothetical protein
MTLVQAMRLEAPFVYFTEIYQLEYPNQNLCSPIWQTTGDEQASIETLLFCESTAFRQFTKLRKLGDNLI